MGEERGSLRGQEKTPDKPGHHCSTGNLIYLFSFASFLRCRYVFCLHPTEQVLASQRDAVNSSPQISQRSLSSHGPRQVFMRRGRALLPLSAARAVPLLSYTKCLG